MAFAWKGSSSAKTLILGAGITGRYFGSSTATVTTSALRTTVVEGEAVFLDATQSGFSITDETKEADFLWNFDQSGATHTADVPYSDANYHRAPKAVTAYATAGTYNPSCAVRSASASASDSITITVEDPDTVTWDRDVYVSFAGTTTGWPTETGAVEHITSAAEWAALTFSTASQSVRITFRDDETYTFTTAHEKSLGGNDCFYYVTRDFAGTNRPVFSASASSTDFWAVFDVNRNEGSKRIVFYGLELQGGYDPTTGAAPNGEIKLMSGAKPDTASNTPQITFNSCKAVGAGLMVSDGAGGDGFTDFAAINCECSDWSDYAFGMFGGQHRPRISGCNFSQNPLALMRDGKEGAFPEGPDHGPIRSSSHQDGSIFNCKLRSTNGWSPNASIDKAAQPCIRILPTSATTEWTAYIQDNDLFGAYGNITVGQVNGSVFVTTEGKFVIAGNKITAGRQNRTNIDVQVTTGAIYNNVCYFPDTRHFNQNPEFVVVRDESNSTAARAGTLYIGYNTFFSDLNVGSVTKIDDAQWTGGTITDEHNIVDADGNSNSGDFTDYSPLSRADNFKPVTGSGAIDAVTSGFYPVRDFDGNLRTSTTNKGAHHDDVASDSGVSAPSNSVVPTIAELSTFAGEYAMSSLGTWSNGEDYYIEWDWKMDGVAVAVGGNANYAELTTVDVSALDDSTGNLTLDVTMTNKSGTRVTATSNTIAV